MANIKYKIGDKVRAKIHYQNDERTEVEAVIYGIQLDYLAGEVKYKIRFEPDDFAKEQGCTDCEGFISPDDIMEDIITLKQLAKIQNWLAKGVRIAFCSDENAFVTEKIDMINFKEIKEKVNNPEKYRVFRIDTSNDLICVYVIAV